MKYAVLLPLATVLLTGCATDQSGERDRFFDQFFKSDAHGYPELMTRSDLVVMASAIASQDTTNTVNMRDCSGGCKAIGVKTRLNVHLVLKGDAKLKQISVLHYRASRKTCGHAPAPFRFLPSTKRPFWNYILFLQRDPALGLVPTTGPMYPSWSAFAVIDRRFQRNTRQATPTEALADIVLLCQVNRLHTKKLEYVVEEVWKHNRDPAFPHKVGDKIYSKDMETGVSYPDQVIAFYEKLGGSYEEIEVWSVFEGHIPFIRHGRMKLEDYKRKVLDTIGKDSPPQPPHD